MPDPARRDTRIELSPGIVRFIERMGLYYEHLGVPRIGGRILGLLMMARRPLTLDDMASLLHVSRASISTNARMNVAVGMVRHVSLPGDRRDYYIFSPNAWEERLAVGKPTSIELRDIITEGLAALSASNDEGRARLSEAIEFCDFLLEETEKMTAHWRERVGRLRATREHAREHTPDTPIGVPFNRAPDLAPDAEIATISEIEEAGYDGHD